MHTCEYVRRPFRAFLCFLWRFREWVFHFAQKEVVADAEIVAGTGKRSGSGMHGDRHILKAILWGAVGLAANLGLLLLPLALTGKLVSGLADPSILVLLLGASIFCACDLSVACYAHARHPRPGTRHDGQARVLAAATGVTVLLVFWTALAMCATLRAPVGPLCLLGGGLLFVGGSALRLTAIHTLGPSFATEVTVRPDQRLVLKGVYRYVRHPSETGLFLVTLGAGVLAGSIAVLVVWCGLLVPLVLTRIHLEERCLHAAFGPRYDRYVHRVRRLIPFIC
jgi:protein-S-isoprenylcysteine O-methyltransferase